MMDNETFGASRADIEDFGMLLTKTKEPADIASPFLQSIAVLDCKIK